MQLLRAMLPSTMTREPVRECAPCISKPYPQLLIVRTLLNQTELASTNENALRLFRYSSSLLFWFVLFALTLSACTEMRSSRRLYEIPGG